MQLGGAQGTEVNTKDFWKSRPVPKDGDHSYLGSNWEAAVFQPQKMPKEQALHVLRSTTIHSSWAGGAKPLMR